MNKYLSFGAGVNSTALLLLLLDKGESFETVFADTGAEWPETYSYLDYLKDKGFKIATVKANVSGHNNLYEYCIHYRILPSRIFRWCTEKFKIKPLRSYFRKPWVCYLAIAAEEDHRAYPFEKDGMKNEYPLVEEGIDREGCIEIIRAHGLDVPVKSGCYFCPYQKVSKFKHLRDEHSDLWCKVKRMEQLAIERYTEKGNKPFYLVGRDKPLDEVVVEGQSDFFGWRKPCNCELE